MILSKRHCFIGFHVTKQVRDRLRQEAALLGISVSMLVYKTLLKSLNMRDESQHTSKEVVEFHD